MGARRPAQFRPAASALDDDVSSMGVVVVNHRYPALEAQMSERNGDRARFQKNRKRKLLKRQRLQRLMLAIRAKRPALAGQAQAAGGK